MVWTVKIISLSGKNRHGEKNGFDSFFNLKKLLWKQAYATDTLYETCPSVNEGRSCPRFLQIRLRHESRDKYVIHISKTAFQKNAILKRRITKWALWGSRTSHVVNDPPLSCFGATYWYVAIEVNFFPNFKLFTTHSYLIIFWNMIWCCFSYFCITENK